MVNFGRNNMDKNLSICSSVDMYLEDNFYNREDNLECDLLQKPKFLYKLLR